MSRQKRRILQIYYEPVMSGITRHVAFLLKSLESEDFDFHVLCSTDDRRIRKELIRMVPGDHIRIVPAGRIFSVMGFSETCKIVRTFRPDLVHVHNMQTVFWAYAAAVVSGCRRIVFTPQVDGFGMASVDRLCWVMLRLLTPVPMTFVAVSPAQQDRMRSRLIPGPHGITCVANHIDGSAPAFRAARSPRVVRRENGLSGNAVIVCQPARLDRQKDPLFLIRTAELVKRRNPEIVFMLIGDGPLRGAVVREIEQRNLNGTVRVMGYRHDGLELMGASDIITLTSRWEGLPYAVLEGFCLNKPAVVTDVPGNRDLVADGKSGFVVKTEADFAEALLRLAGMKELREAMGKHGHERVGPMLDREHFARQMKRVYDIQWQNG